MANEPKSTDHQAVKELTRKVRHEKWIWTQLVTGLITALLSTLATILPIFIGKVGWGQVSTFLQTFGWFIAGVIAFQLGIIAFTIFLRKRHKRVLALRKAIINSYLIAIDKSALNPEPTNRGLLVE